MLSETHSNLFFLNLSFLNFLLLVMELSFFFFRNYLSVLQVHVVHPNLFLEADNLLVFLFILFAFPVFGKFEMCKST